MYAMIRGYRMGAGSIDDLMHKVDTQFADRLQAALGLLGYLAIDTGNDTIMTITLFETEDDCRRSQTAAEGVRYGLAEFEVESTDAFFGPVLVSRAGQGLLEPTSGYAIVRRYRTETGSIDAMVKRVDRDFADRIPDEVGSTLYSAVDTGDGTAMTITLFGDEETARRSEATVARVQESLGEFQVEEIDAFRGAVRVSRADPRALEPVHP